MKQTLVGQDHRIRPRSMAADDPDVPDIVRSQLGNFDAEVAAVRPVVAIDRIEWMLFDAAGKLLGSVSDGPLTRGTH